MDIILKNNFLTYYKSHWTNYKNQLTVFYQKHQQRIHKYLLYILMLPALFYLLLTISLLFLDLNPYKDKISQWIFEKTGETVLIEGPIQFSIFPYIRLDAENISLKEKPGSHNLFIKAKNIKMYPKLHSLLWNSLVCNLEIEDLQVNSYHIQHFKTKYKLKEGVSEFFVSKILIHSAKPENVLEIDYLKIDTNSHLPKYCLKHQTNHFPLSFLLTLLQSQTQFTGDTSVNMDLTSEGITPEQIKQALNGQLVIELKQGKVNGLDVIASLKEAKSLIQSLTSILTNHFSIFYHAISHKKEKNTSSTAYENIKIKALIHNGIIHKDLNISHNHYHVKGTGNINLRSNTIDYLLEARYKKHGIIKDNPSSQNNLAPLKIHISGNLEKPNVKTDLNSYVKFISQKESQKQTKTQKATKTSKISIKPLKKILLEKFG